MSNQPLAEIFDGIFERILIKKKIPHYKAYEEAEDEFASEFKHRKYASFESYRVSRTSRYKNRKKR